MFGGVGGVISMTRLGRGHTAKQKPGTNAF